MKVGKKNNNPDKKNKREIPSKEENITEIKKKGI